MCVSGEAGVLCVCVCVCVCVMPEERGGKRHAPVGAGHAAPEADDAQRPLEVRLYDAMEWNAVQL